MIKYNSSIRFPDRQTLEDLIDYVNSDITNKFTLIINSTISRPDTSAGMNLPPIGRRTSRSYSHSNAADLDNNANNGDILMTSRNDEEFFKVPTLYF